MSYYQPQQLCDMIPVLSWCDGFHFQHRRNYGMFFERAEPSSRQSFNTFAFFRKFFMRVTLYIQIFSELLSIFKFLAFHFITKKNKVKQNKNKILSVQDSRPDVESVSFLMFFYQICTLYNHEQS